MYKQQRREILHITTTNIYRLPGTKTNFSCTYQGSTPSSWALGSLSPPQCKPWLFIAWTTTQQPVFFYKHLSHSSYLLKTIQWFSTIISVKHKNHYSGFSKNREREVILDCLFFLISHSSIQPSPVMHSRPVPVLLLLYLLLPLPGMRFSSTFRKIGPPFPSDTCFQNHPFKKGLYWPERGEEMAHDTEIFLKRPSFTTHILNIPTLIFCY